MFTRFFLLSMILLIGCETSTDSQENGERKKAPDFTLSSTIANNTNNGDISLSDYDGKVVYLFFLGYNCPPCIDKAPRTTNIFESFSSDSVQVLGLDAWDGSISGAADFIIQTGIEYPVLIDAGRVADQYDVIQEYSVLVDKNGLIAYKKSGIDRQEIKETINQLLLE